MTTEPFRIGLIGAGITGQLRARAVRRIAHARLVALAAADRDQAEAICREHPGVRILTDASQAVATVAPPMAEEVAVPAVATGAVAATPAEPEVLTERKPKEEAADEKEKDTKKK